MKPGSKTAFYNDTLSQVLDSVINFPGLTYVSNFEVIHDKLKPAAYKLIITTQAWKIQGYPQRIRLYRKILKYEDPAGLI